MVFINIRHACLKKLKKKSQRIKNSDIKTSVSLIKMPVMNKNKTKNQTNKPGYKLQSAALTNPSD